MIPAATIPQVPQMPCTPDGPCWVAGTGFRPIDDTGTSCALIDTPMAGKLPIFYGTNDIDHPLRSLFMTWGAAETSGGATHVSVEDTPAPAPVPLPGAGGILVVGLVTAAIAVALMKFAAVDEAVRGPDSGRP